MQSAMDKKMSRRVFIEALKSKDFMTTDQAVARLNKRNYWDDEQINDAILEFKKTHVRRMIRQVKDERGRPVFANIEITDGEGETRNGYMQVALFDVEHYRQVIDYNIKCAQHFIREAYHYQKELRERYGKQVKLPFDAPAEEAVA